MGRLIILFLPLLAVTFMVGVGFGRGRKRRAVMEATEQIRPVVVAARRLVDTDILGNPVDANLRRQMMEAALDDYDAATLRAIQ